MDTVAKTIRSMMRSFEKISITSIFSKVKVGNDDFILTKKKGTIYWKSTCLKYISNILYVPIID